MESNVVLEAPPLALDIADERVLVDGTPAALGSKSFLLLKALMEAPEQLITKDALIERVWEGRAVSDAVLTTAMRELRRAIGDDARRPTYIETVHGRGYRFLKPVATRPVEKAAASAGQGADAASLIAPNLNIRVLLLAAFVIGLAATIAVLWRDDLSNPGLTRSAPHDGSIAVLPFDDLSPQQDQSYFSDGLAEEILNSLVRVDGLKVASRTSAFAYREKKDEGIPQIASELGVQHVLEGSVRKAGDRVRVTAQLIRAETDVHLWSQTYERELTVDNLFDIQDEIARAIVIALSREMHAERPRGANAPESAAGTASLAAYDAYLRARALFVSRQNLEEARRLARVAVDADPAFARAWELLGSIAFIDGGQATAEALEAVAIALRLDPSLSLAHAVQGVMANLNPPYDWAAAVDNLQRAVELDPTNTTALLWLGVEMRKLGYLDQAETHFSQCLEIDPAYARCRHHLMWTLYMKGETDAAIAIYDALLAAGAPPDDAVLMPAAITRADDDRIAIIAASLSDAAPLPAIVLTALRGEETAVPGARAAFRSWADAQEFNRRDVYPIALALGDYAFVEARQGSFIGLWLPDFPEFRRSPQFHKIVTTLEMDDYWRAEGFPPQCRPVGESGFACD